MPMNGEVDVGTLSNCSIEAENENEDTFVDVVEDVHGGERSPGD